MMPAFPLSSGRDDDCICISLLGVSSVELRSRSQSSTFEKAGFETVCHRAPGRHACAPAAAAAPPPPSRTRRLAELTARPPPGRPRRHNETSRASRARPEALDGSTAGGPATRARHWPGVVRMAAAQSRVAHAVSRRVGVGAHRARTRRAARSEATGRTGPLSAATCGSAGTAGRQARRRWSARRRSRRRQKRSRRRPSGPTFVSARRGPWLQATLLRKPNRAQLHTRECDM